MRAIKRLLAATAAIVIAATSLTVTGTAAPAQAAGCRVAPYPGFVSMAREHSGELFYKTFTTTTRCRDIQMLGVLHAGPRSARWYDVCVVFIDKTSGCNYWSRVRNGQWTNIATNVKDRVRFQIAVQVPVGAGQARGWVDF